MTTDVRIAWAKEARLLNQIMAPLGSIVKNDPNASAALEEYRGLRGDRRDTRERVRPAIWTGPQYTQMLVGPGEWTIVGPPFETWGQGFGDALGTGCPPDKAGKRYADPNGSFGFDTGCRGDFLDLGAGVGVTLTVTHPMTVQLAADASFDYSWNDEAGFVVSHTSGFIGLYIQDIDPAGNITIASDRRAYLWNDGVGWLESHGDSGSGFWTDWFAQPTFLSLQEGHTYVVWTWAWGTADGNSSGCAINADQYAVVVRAVTPSENLGAAAGAVAGGG